MKIFGSFEVILVHKISGKIAIKTMQNDIIYDLL